MFNLSKISKESLISSVDRGDSKGKDDSMV